MNSNGMIVEKRERLERDVCSMVNLTETERSQYIDKSINTKLIRLDIYDTKKDQRERSIHR